LLAGRGKCRFREVIDEWRFPEDGRKKKRKEQDLMGGGAIQGMKDQLDLSWHPAEAQTPVEEKVAFFGEGFRRSGFSPDR